MYKNYVRRYIIPLFIQHIYQDLVEKLSKCSGGILINNDTYNVFCYGDDLILTSLSVTGLQELIDTANSYITDHCLKFNPTLQCRNFEDTPQRHLNKTILREEATATYLGNVLSTNTKHHIDTRINAAHRAFNGLQSAGLCADGVSPIVSAHMLSVAIQPIL